MKITTETQTVNDSTGKVIRKLNYLTFENKKGETLTINVGEKTAKAVTELNKNDK